MNCIQHGLTVYILFVSFQVLTQKVEQATKSRIGLIKRLDKAREEIEDLRFQVSIRYFDNDIALFITIIKCCF